MKRISILLIVLIMGVISSCSFFNDANEGSGKRVARIGTHVLYESEIDKLMPDGISAEDSIDMVEQYINSWAMEHLYEDLANRELSKSDLDVSKELDAYRRSLLKYRYEQSYVNQRLDTVITEDDILDKMFNENNFGYAFMNISKYSITLPKRVSTCSFSLMIVWAELIFNSALVTE